MIPVPAGGTAQNLFSVRDRRQSIPMRLERGHHAWDIPVFILYACRL